MLLYSYSNINNKTVKKINTLHIAHGSSGKSKKFVT